MTAESISYSCVKCTNPTFKAEDVALTGAKWGRYFDHQGKKFTAIMCENCGYTDFYRIESSKAANILDILVGS